MYYLNRTCPPSHRYKGTLVFFTQPYMGVPMCSTCNKVAMVMTERACCIDVMYVYYASCDLLGFQHSLCF